MPDRNEIEVHGRTYTVQFERHIVAGQREVMLTAFDARGTAVVRSAMSTAAARSYLPPEEGQVAPTWEQLEDIALVNLKLELED